MSLLLDALQRASEEKKKLAEAAGAPAGDMPPASVSPAGTEDAAVAATAPEASAARPTLSFPPLDLEPEPAQEEAANSGDTGLASARTEPTPDLELEVAEIADSPHRETPGQAALSLSPVAPAEPFVEPSVHAAPLADAARALPEAADRPGLAPPPPAEPYDAPRVARDIVETSQPKAKKRIDPRIALLLAALLILGLVTAGLFMYSEDEALAPGSMAVNLPPESETATPEGGSPVASSAALHPEAGLPPGTHANPAPPGLPMKQAEHKSARDTATDPRRKTLFTASVASSGLLDQAYQALKQGQLDAAGAAYREALRANPGEIDAMLGLAYIARSQGDNEAAAGQYVQVLRLQPGHPEANAGLLALAPEADMASALSRVREIAAKNPNSAEAQATLGSLLVKQKRMAEAQLAYFKAYTLDPNNALYAYNLPLHWTVCTSPPRRRPITTGPLHSSRHSPQTPGLPACFSRRSSV
jgi:tetratricopeptide (TPR) repeat protein